MEAIQLNPQISVKTANLRFVRRERHGKTLTILQQQVQIYQDEDHWVEWIDVPLEYDA